MGPAWWALGPLRVLGRGQEEIKEYGSVSRPPSRSLTPLDFGAAGNVSPVPFPQVTCAEAAPAVPLWVPCDLVPWCLTFLVEVCVGSSGARIP